MRILPPALLLVLLLAIPAFAGEEEPGSSTIGEVLARLSIDDPAEQAWGCYLAGRDGHKGAIAQVVDVLRAHTDAKEQTWRLAHRSALDALIRLDAPVPPALLARHDGRLSIHVLVLRARDPKAHVEALKERFEGQMKRDKLGLFGVAIGNLLLGVRPDGFAADLLGRLRAKLIVRVFDSESNGVIGLGGGAMGGFGDAVARVPEGFPPYAWYGLKGEARPGYAVLAAGPRPVWVQRRERATSGMVGGGRAWYLDPTDTCLEWIAALLGKDRKALSFQKESSAYVTWTHADAYVAWVTKKREEMLTPWWAIVRGLLDARRLTPAEVFAYQPSLELVVEDTREDRSAPIPDLPAAARPAWATAPAR